MKKNIIGITGGSGVLGSKLIENNKKIYLFKKFKGDISDKKDVFNWIKDNNFDYIIHLAAKVPIKYVEKNYRLSLKVNFNGTKNLVDAINFYNKKIKWFFFSSTAQIYNFSKNKINEKSKKKCISKYGLTKLMAERYIINNLDSNIKFSIGRIFSYTDKKQTLSYFIPSIREKIKKAKKIFYIEKFEQKRDFIHINDLSRAILLLLKIEYNGVINIGSGKSVKIDTIVKFFSNKYKKKIIYIKSKNKKKQDLCPNISKLKKIGFKNNYSLRDILEDLN
tara:strand:+ start:241 stop:1074 length:834 start_codon:yes stop_codon:yes gene_type:complete